MKKRVISFAIILTLLISLLPAALPSAMAFGDMGKIGKTNPISLGEGHSAAIDEKGDLYTWGGNFVGQLGHGDKIDRNKPTKVTALPNVIAVSLGYDYTAALTASGGLYTWGLNYNGQLGHGEKSNKDIPTRVTGITNVVAICAGISHCAAIRGDGDLYTWGHNNLGQLGHGGTSIADVTEPVKVEALSNVIAVTLGFDTSAAITADGDLYTWGDNFAGQLGYPKESPTKSTVNTPTKVTALSNVVAVSMGYEFSAAITANGDLYTWGENYFGQLGHGNTTALSTPTKVTSLSNVVAVSTGYGFTAAITANGDLYTWGDNIFGQLGHGDYEERHKPEKVKSLSNVIAVALGLDYCAVVLADNDLYNWGANYRAQLGLGDTEDYTEPEYALPDVQLPGNTPFVEVTGRISSYNPQRKTNITLYEANTNNVVATAVIKEVDGSGQVTQTFTLKGVPPEGTYDLLVTKETHVNYKITGVVVGSENLDLSKRANPNINLISPPCGDIDGDGFIDSSDLTILIIPQNYDKKATDPGVNPRADLVGAGYVNSSSITVIIIPANYNKTHVTYPYS